MFKTSAVNRHFEIVQQVFGKTEKSTFPPEPVLKFNLFLWLNSARPLASRERWDEMETVYKKPTNLTWKPPGIPVTPGVASARQVHGRSVALNFGPIGVEEKSLLISRTAEHAPRRRRMEPDRWEDRGRARLCATLRRAD